MHLMVFVATISCALACPQFNVGQGVSESSSESQPNGCCAHPINGRCLECVNTDFFEESKHATVAATIPKNTCIELSETHPCSQPLHLATYVSSEAIFLTNSVLLI